MIKELEKYAGIKILMFFIQHPNTRAYIKELSRMLKISPATASFFCKLYNKDHIFTLSRIGNVFLYELNNSSVYVKNLKKAFSLLFFRQKGIEKTAESSISCALYGSYASGEYNEESDIDILRIMRGKLSRKNILEFEKKIGKNVQLSDINYIEWEKMKKEGSAFAKEVIKNHILLKGESI